MKLRCPFCHAPIELISDGVQCAGCAAAHHKACWDEHGGKCSVFGCGSTRHRPLGKLAPARIALAAGRFAVASAIKEARERLGGKSTVVLFALSCIVSGLGAAPLLYRLHASRKVEIEFLLGGLFAILFVWITALLYRGAHLEDDLTLRPVERGPGDYFWIKRVPGGSDLSGCNGCGDVGCAGADLEGLVVGVAVLAAIVLLVVVVLPLVAWLAVEVVFPIVVLSVYFTLYSALAFAVNRHESMAGKLGACMARALGYSALYTAVVALVLAAGVQAFSMYSRG